MTTDPYINSLTDEEVRCQLKRFRDQYAKALDYVCLQHFPVFPPNAGDNLFAVDTLIHELENRMLPPLPYDE